MPITHTNRKGVVYYLHEGQTATAKLRYHFSKDKAGTLPDTIPPGYEIYESPRGQVYLRRIPPRNVRPDEIALIEREVRQRAGLSVFLVEVKRDAIEVHLPDHTPDDLRFLFEGLARAGPTDRQSSAGSAGAPSPRPFVSSCAIERPTFSPCSAGATAAQSTGGHTIWLG